MTDWSDWRRAGTRRGADDVAARPRCAARPSTRQRRVRFRRRRSRDHRRRCSRSSVDLEPDARGRGRYGSLIAAAGAAALVGVGALAVTAMFGSGGAGSPEGAVRQLADAVSHKDPLAAVDVLVPTEVRSMRADVEPRDQARRRPEDRRQGERSRSPASISRSTISQLSTAAARRRLRQGRRSRAVRSRRARTRPRCRSCCSRRSTTPTRTRKGDVDLARLASSCRPPDVRRHRAPRRRLVREPGVHRARVRARGQRAGRPPTSVRRSRRSSVPTRPRLR